MDAHGDGRVAVIGAGPAGLVATLALLRQGFDVTVFEKRAAPEERRTPRWQAVGIDDTALARLDELEVPTRDLLTPLERVVVLAGARDPGTCIARPELTRSLNPGSPLTAVLGRRKPVALVGIGECEALLWQMVSAQPRAKLKPCTQLEGLRVGPEGIAVSFTELEPSESQGLAPTTEHFSWVIVADGAHSAESGALSLLALGRRQVAPSLHLLIAQSDGTRRAGELMMRYAMSERLSYVTAMALRERTVLMSEVPEGSPSSAQALFEELPIELGIGGRLLKGPLPFDCHISVARRLEVGGRLLVIGDAAFSGSPLPGVHFNRAVLEAYQAAQVLAQLREDPRRGHAELHESIRERQLMYAGLAAQESALGTLYRLPKSPLSALPAARTLAALGLRSAVRMRFSWSTLQDALLENAVDALNTGSVLRSALRYRNSRS